MPTRERGASGPGRVEDLDRTVAASAGTVDQRRGDAGQLGDGARAGVEGDGEAAAAAAVAALVAAVLGHRRRRVVVADDAVLALAVALVGAGRLAAAARRGAARLGLGAQRVERHVEREQ